MYNILKGLTACFHFFRKYKFLYFVALMGVLVICAFTTRPDESPSYQKAGIAPPDSLSKFDLEGTKLMLNKIKLQRMADSLVAFALSLEGVPYRYGGESPKGGFDCSGFVFHIYRKFGLDHINRSSRTQAVQGIPVTPEEVQKGDLLFFTGTNPQVKEVGHVGIVISEPGEEVQFVHSSSNGGVKISDLSGYYETRFMVAKRLIEPK